MMDEKKIFLILGIEQTKDEEAVRNAYRQKLRLVNPEDDPEGFKQLREAYEAALAFVAKKEESEEPAADDTPSGLFVRKASALYESIEGRQDGEAWKELFHEPAFVDLEEEENCRKKLFEFLMKHIYFPTHIWKILDDNLQIISGKAKLYETFPKDFVDFLVRKAQRGEDFEFDQLSGPENADLDSWILLFSKAGREENEKNYEAMEETIRQAKQTGISHPGLSLMQARMLYATRRADEGDEIVDELLNGPFQERLNVRFQAAEYFWESGRTDKAALLYQKIRETDKRHYMSNRRLAKWYLDRGEYAAAKECVNVILSYPLDDEGKALVNSVNAGLELSLTDRLKERPDDLKARMDLSWCWLQDEKPQKALELMKDIVPAPEQEKDYMNLMGKLHFYAKDYENAIPLISRWIVLLTQQMPEGGQEKEDDQERLATAHSMLSQIHLEWAKQAEGERRDADFAVAVRELDAAKQAHYNPGQDYGQASIYLEWGKYEECIKICNELKEKYPDFSAAVILHQKASAKKYDASAVIGDYFTLRQLAPDYTGSWELAAEVYYQLKRWEDLERLLGEAEENKVLNAHLKRYRFFDMVQKAQKKDELLAALEYARRISEEGEKENWTAEEKAEFLSERARNYWRLNGNETALQLIGQAIELAPANLTYRYIKAGIKKDQEAYEEALQIYLSCRQDYDETPHFYANVGECYYRLRKNQDALEYLKKAVEMKEDSPVCCTWIGRILKAEMERTQRLDLMDEAIYYTDLMIRYRNSSFDYIERGLLYALAQDYEAAAKDFEQAVSVDEKDPFAHSNLARMYRLLNRLPEAETQARQAISLMDKEPAPYHYEMLGKILWQMQRYEEALNTYREIWNRFPKQKQRFVDDMIGICKESGKWQIALDLLKECYGESGKEYTEKVSEVYCAVGFYEQAAKFVKFHYDSAGFNVSEKMEEFADIYWYQGDLVNGANAILQSLKNCHEDSERYPRLCRKAANLYFFLGRTTEKISMFREAEKWAKEALAYYRKHGGFEKWLNPLEDRMERLYEAAALQLYAGNITAAEAILSEMKSHPRCIYCHYCFCVDANELEADILLAKGALNGAVKLYETVLSANKMDKSAGRKLAIVRKKLEEQEAGAL
ncbi:MAG: tetratricopeptide repeat protein [Eubacteriales bacterium]|nr:tetratricopeptide repeat protein [Eubacteriales bacterium]